MGNHVAGRAVGHAAEIAIKARLQGETALALLDRVCKKYRGYDAEFEAEDPNNPGTVHPDYDSYTDPHPNAALGMLMVEAFAPNGLTDLPKYAAMLNGEGDEEEAACDAWWQDVYEPFRKRYGFC
jgi:hypothetical protein